MLQYVVDGVSVGAIYAMLALSFWVIFASTRTFHLAHAIVYTSSAYLLYSLYTSWGVPLVFALLATGLWAAGLGMLIEALLYRRVRRAGDTGLLLFVVSAAVLTLGQALVALTYGEQPQGLTQSQPDRVLRSPVTITSYDIWTVATALVLAIVAIVLLRRTRAGRSLRASMDNPEFARALGIRVDRVHLYCFAIGSVLLVPPVAVTGLTSGVTPEMGLTPTLVAVVAVIAGGVGSAVGAIAVGFLLGLLENLSLIWINASWQDVLTFSVLVIVLLFFPGGIRPAPAIRAHTVGAR